jgi:hypothetical protein
MLIGFKISRAFDHLEGYADILRVDGMKGFELLSCLNDLNIDRNETKLSMSVIHLLNVLVP